jgi:NADH-quinone oxidoreductase subunit G
VVDICPVGALTSTRFRFSERVWYLDKKPSICTGCDVGCNITLEHRRGAIRRYKPRINPEVNDHWMCDDGRASHERYSELPRLAVPQLRRGGELEAVGWKEALDALFQSLRARRADGAPAILGSGNLTTEDAFLLTRLSAMLESPNRALWVDSGPARHIPNPSGGLTGRDAAPNRRGAELAGLVPGAGGIEAEDLLLESAAEGCSVLLVADSDFGKAAHDPRVIERLRKARFLVVMGWAETALSQAADLVLPVATHAERSGTFVNVEGRLQRFDRAFPPPTQVRSAVAVLADLLSRFDPKWGSVDEAVAFDLLAEDNPEFATLRWSSIPATGARLRARGAGGAP